MYLFTGTEERGFFAAEALRGSGESLRCLGPVPELLTAFDEIIAEPCNGVVLDIETLTDSFDQITKLASKIFLATNRKIIAFAPGYSRETEVLTALSHSGVTSFVTAMSLTGQIEQLREALEGKGVPIEQEEQDGHELPAAPIVMPLFPVPFHTVAVAGSLPRIGATTQSLQIVKYLLLHGKNACYLEMNQTGFVDAVREYCDCTAWDKNLGRVICQGVDLFCRQEKISEVLKLGYDYYIYDFGSYGNRLFQRVPFLEKEYRILVTGASPTEIESMKPIFEDLHDESIQYLFSFCPEREQKDVLCLMEDLSSHTFFPEYMPDAFCYSSKSDVIFDKLFNLPPVAKQAKGTRGLFGRRHPLC